MNFERGYLCIDSLDWIKKKKTTTNSKNKDDKCLNMQQRLYYILVKLSGTEKEFKILNRLQINITGMK